MTRSGLLGPGGSTTEAVESQTVERPGPGLARGRWEAPSFVFYAVAIAAIVGGLAWGFAALRRRRAGGAGR